MLYNFASLVASYVTCLKIVNFGRGCSVMKRLHRKCFDAIFWRLQPTMIRSLLVNKLTKHPFFCNISLQFILWERKHILHILNVIYDAFACIANFLSRFNDDRLRMLEIVNFWCFDLKNRIIFFLQTLALITFYYLIKLQQLQVYGYILAFLTPDQQVAKFP